MVQAAVVEVDGSAHRHPVIADADLAVTESRRIFIDFHAVARQCIVVGPRDAVDHLFVGDAGSDYPHIDAALGGQPHGVDHLLGDDQVRRDKPHIMLRLLDDAQIDILAHRLIVDRGIRKRLHKAPGFRKIRLIREVSPVIPVVPVVRTDGVPHFQKHRREVLHGLAADLYPGILPVPVGMRDIEILVGEIVAAGEGGLPVHDHHLAVVAVVQEHIEDRSHGVEHPALNAQAPHFVDEVRVDEAAAAEVVVKDPDLDACRGLLHHDFQEFVEGFLVLDGVVFQEDEMLRLLQLLHLCFQRLPRVAVIGDITVAVHRKMRIFRQVPGDGGCIPVFALFPQNGALLLRNHREKLGVDRAVPAPHRPGCPGQTDQKVKGDAGDRVKHDQDNPRRPHGDGLVLGIDADHQDECEDPRDQRHPLIVVQVGKGDDDQPHLQADGDHSENDAQHAVAGLRLLLNGLFVGGLSAGRPDRVHHFLLHILRCGGIGGAEVFPVPSGTVRLLPSAPGNPPRVRPARSPVRGRPPVLFRIRISHGHCPGFPRLPVKSSESSQIVNGPSLTRETCMCAPNTPVSTTGTFRRHRSAM